MEKSKEQILLEKLRKVSHRVRMGQMMRPGMPPMDGAGCRRGMRPMDPGRKCQGDAQVAPHGPGMCQAAMQHPVPEIGRPPMGQPGPGMPPHRGHCGPGGMSRPGMLLPREMLLLAVLEQGENGIRQKDLASAMGINASSLSEQIDRLETERYLERRANPEDKRSTLIFLTEKGKARAWETQDERQRAAEQFCAQLTDEEKDTLIRLLDKLLNA